MKYKVLMEPDYGNVLFWDEESCCIGGCNSFSIDVDGNEIVIDLSCISGLKNGIMIGRIKPYIPQTLVLIYNGENGGKRE